MVVFILEHKVNTFVKPSTKEVFRRSVTKPWGSKKIPGESACRHTDENLKKIIKRSVIPKKMDYPEYGTHSFGAG